MACRKRRSGDLNQLSSPFQAAMLPWITSPANDNSAMANNLLRAASNVEDSFDERIRAGAAIEPGEERFGIDRRFP